MNVQASAERKTNGTAHDDGGPDVLAPIVRRSMFWAPDRQAPSAWTEHVPFAFWLVDVLRPRRIVELGTHTGVSYSAMCQAVKALNLATSCFAVDTWKGDKHAGFYEEDVYHDFADFHEKRYGSFSRLVRSTFDEALPYFEDGSIDILHIDGLHTREAVRHDYRSWLPKLSRNAVVLFHDTNVREAEFGVFQLWNEACAGKPHFSFLHGHGLGVLGEGRDYPVALRSLFDAKDDGPLVSAIRETFAALGRSVRALSERPDLDQAMLAAASEAGSLRQLLAAREEQLAEAARLSADHIHEIGALRDTVRTRDGELMALKAGLAERTAEIGALRQTLTTREGELVAARQGLADYSSEVGALRRRLKTRGDELSASSRALAERNSKIGALMQTLEMGEARIKLLNETISAMLASTSWRITAPLRAAKRLSGRAGGSDVRTHPTRDHSPTALDHSSPAYDDSDLIDFDPKAYLELYPDITAAGVDATQHYLQQGRNEGRLGRLPDLDQHPNIDSARETVLVVFHEGSRTGAPILGYNLVLAFLKKYNVIALFLGPGPVLDACAASGAATISLIPAAESGVTMVLGRIVDAVSVKFAVVNSVQSHSALPGLAQHFVPSITLTHEFASYIRPSTAFVSAALWSGNIVFSSRTTMENAWSLPELRGKTFPVVAQGRCILPGGNHNLQDQSRQDALQVSSGAGRIAQVMAPRASAPNTVMVLGVGTVEYRKGVDLFIDCAARVRKQRPDLLVRFVWIGNGYAPEIDDKYSVYLADQIAREDLEDRVFIIDAVQDLSPAYAAADIFLLSSRLDPLPNVTIDALHEGIPVVCFGSGNGLAEILCQNDLGDVCVAREMDENNMAAKVIALASSKELRQRVGSQSVLAAEKAFNMSTYIANIEELAARAARRTQQEKTDTSTIAEAAVARMDYFLPPGHPEDASRAVRAYVRAWAGGVQCRKLFPGFHPGIYLERHGVQETGTDPLADFLRNGQPQGPWLSQLITPADTAPPTSANLRIALHVHAYYPELLQEILDAISVNTIRPDLLISVGSHARRKEIHPLLDDYKGGTVHIRVVPNRGRDLGPLLTEFKEAILRDYDVVGHFHTKRSADVRDPAAAPAWRTFLIENLLGGKAPMTDIIIGKMAADRDIGMVFPDDPNVVGWGLNRPFAEPIARRLALGDLPEYWNFPVGSMFWADVTALKALFKLDLKWPDYPDEPLPYDGSILHSIERLLALIVVAAGKKIAMTNVPGVTR